MNQFDLTNLHRRTVGFDRVFNMLEGLSANEANGNYPPYNIERVSADDYRIVLAVAGFSQDGLHIDVSEGVLTVSGDTSEAKSDDVEVLYRGIANRKFKRQFRLADHVSVTGANLENGYLSLALHRELPEAMKPRVIKIATAAVSKQIIANDDKKASLVG